MFVRKTRWNESGHKAVDDDDDLNTIMNNSYKKNFREGSKKIKMDVDDLSRVHSGIFGIHEKALHQAVRVGNAKDVKRLLKISDINVNAVEDVDDALTLAVKSQKCDRMKILRFLLGHENINVNACNGYAFRYAAEHGFSDIVRLMLLNPSLDVNACGGYALRKAVNTNNSLATVRFLVEDARTNVNINNGEILCDCVRNTRVSILRLLLSNPRIDISQCRFKAFKIALEMDNPLIVQMFFECASMNLDHDQIKNLLNIVHPYLMENQHTEPIAAFMMVYRIN